MSKELERPSVSERDLKFLTTFFQILNNPNLRNYGMKEAKPEASLSGLLACHFFLSTTRGFCARSEKRAAGHGARSAPLPAPSASNGGFRAIGVNCSDGRK